MSNGSHLQSEVDAWLSQRLDYSPNTRNAYRVAVREFVEQVPNQLTAGGAAVYVSNLAQRVEGGELSAASAYQRLAAAVSFTKHLQDVGLVERGPLDVLRRRPKWAIAHPGRYLDEAEMRAELATEL